MTGLILIQTMRQKKKKKKKKKNTLPERNSSLFSANIGLYLIISLNQSDLQFFVTRNKNNILVQLIKTQTYHSFINS